MKPVLPDLLQHEDGSTVTVDSWPKRRTELYNAIIPHEYGGMPPDCVSVESIQRCDAGLYPDKIVKYKTYGIRCVLEAGEICIELSLWIPPGDGPFPVLLDGDGCWTYFNDRIVESVTKRNYIAASFNRTILAADNQERYRETGLYRLYPGGEFGALAAWAWGYHRCVDILTTLDFVQPDQIAITGHSRGGKTVILAGATDERIAVTNPNCSGCGGSGLNHLKAEGAEVVEDFNRSGNIFWFGKGYAEYAGRDKEIPYDQHFLHGLVAPRGLFVTEAFGDHWANPPGSYAACNAAAPVFELLGNTDNLGWAFREGAHAHGPSDYEALLDFLDATFSGKEVLRNFQRKQFPDLDSILV